MAGRAAAGGGNRFELTGGRPCLDLVNTLDARPTSHPRELLSSYADLLAWGEQAALLSPGQARRLRDRARRRGGEAEAARRRALLLREALYSLFSAAAAGRAVPPRALRLLNDALPRALARLRIVGGRGALGWGWSAETEFDRVLWPVIRSAGELLASPARERLRECAAPNCAWLFLDASRNRSRRWCDMSVCGNRAKARRHYRRKRARRRQTAP
ncbi:MAG TPA: ABATE domain-containing protein [Vicinamibacteria bacterium]|nr:ABATE domain-containing protein [Vicinamibacteria bacterium]